MKVNFKTSTKKISFETKKGRPPKTTEKADKVKKVFFKQSELEELEEHYNSKNKNIDVSFSLFLKSLIKKGMKC
jgi:hypothetical protein